MPESTPFQLTFPIKGVDKNRGFSQQEPDTAVDADNVWPVQWETGRARGGTRPGITSVGGPSGTPYNWCEATWGASSTTHVGVAVTTGSGTYTSEDGTAWTQRISTTPSDTFASCAVYKQAVYQASIGRSTIYYYDLSAGLQWRFDWRLFGHPTYLLWSSSWLARSFTAGWRPRRTAHALRLQDQHSA